jgi:tetratricopeptide (TPR) repeat protein
VSDTSRDVLAPTDGTNIYGLTVRGLRFLGITTRDEISGEVTENAARELSLTLRMRGYTLTAKSIGPADTPEGLLEPGALAVMRRVQPYIEAAWLYERDPERAKQLALDLVARLPEADTNAVYAHNLLGNIHDDRDETDAAIQEYRMAIRLNRKYAHPHFNLGNIHRKLGDTAAAIREYQAAIRLDRKYGAPHNGLGNIYADRGPAWSDYGPHNGLGIIYMARSDTWLDAAIQEYQIAIRLDPRDARAHTNLGVAYAKSRQSEAAIQEHQKAIRLNPNFAAPHNNLGDIYYNAHRTDDAIKEYQTALVHDPQNAIAHSNLADIYQERGNTEAAIQEYQTAISLKPTDPYPHYKLALALITKAESASKDAKRGSLVEACSHAVAAVSLARPANPDYVKFVQALNEQVPCKVAPSPPR